MFSFHSNRMKGLSVRCGRCRMLTHSWKRTPISPSMGSQGDGIVSWQLIGG